MQEYLDFARNNPLLFLGFFAVLGLIIWTELGRIGRKHNMLPVNNAVRLMNDDKTVIIDVRDDSEVEGGRSGGACKTLTTAGFENVNNLEGGIMAWETASLPLAKR